MNILVYLSVTVTFLKVAACKLQEDTLKYHESMQPSFRNLTPFGKESKKKN